MIDDDSWKKRSDLTTKEEPTKNKSTNCLKYSYLKFSDLKDASFVFRKEDFYF